MSKKSKLILATAVFGAALFGASCGGGGGTASAPPPPPPPPPPLGVDGQVLALLNVGTASAGTLKPVTICKLKSDGKAYCENDLNPSANVDLEYLYEFPLPNGNVVLKDTSGVLYFFDGSQVIRPDKYRALNATSSTPETTAPGGITLPSSPTYYATSNFAIAYNGTTNELVVVTRDGKVIKDDGVSVSPTKLACAVVTKSGTDYKLNTDGTSSNITATIPDEVLYGAGDKSLVRKGTRVYLSDSGCSATGVLVDTLSSVDDVQMVKVGDDFYIAVRAVTALRYYKVSGNTPTPLNTTIALNVGDRYVYALDGMGRLYAIDAANTVSVYNIDGKYVGNATVAGISGLLALADRVLAKNGTNANEITTTGSTVNAVDKGGGALYTALNRCTDETNTRAIDGVRTNFIRCLYDDDSATNIESLHSLRYDSGTYVSASYPLSGASSSLAKALFGAGKVLVRPGNSSSPILLCNTTNTPTISCSSTDFPDFDLTNINTNKYLKFFGNDVFYTIGSGTLKTLKVGNVFDPPSALPITVDNPSGGNASFDLTKFAFSFTPAGDPCATQIAYLSSRTASPKTYTIAQPSNACVARILKVY
jgi:hypothetical protein